MSAPIRDSAATRTERAARLMELLGLTEDELCTVLDFDPLTLLSGQLDHRPELPILLDLLAEPAEQAGPTVLRRWVRAAGPSGVPIDALLRRDFGAFEDALADLADRGFVLRGGGLGGLGPLSHKLRPRYAECDVQGVVFNAHYLTYIDTSITELWRAGARRLPGDARPRRRHRRGRGAAAVPGPGPV